MSSCQWHDHFGALALHDLGSELGFFFPFCPSEVGCRQLKIYAPMFTYHLPIFQYISLRSFLLKALKHEGYNNKELLSLMKW